MSQFRDKADEFQKLNTQIVGVSIDSPYCQKRFSEDLNLNLPLVSDFNREVVQKYGIYVDELRGLKGVNKRSVFVIDRSGIVRYRWVTDDPRNLPDLAVILQEVRKITSGVR